MLYRYPPLKLVDIQLLNERYIIYKLRYESKQKLDQYTSTWGLASCFKDQHFCFFSESFCSYVGAVWIVAAMCGCTPYTGKASEFHCITIEKSHKSPSAEMCSLENRLEVKKQLFQKSAACLHYEVNVACILWGLRYSWLTTAKSS